MVRHGEGATAEVASQDKDSGCRCHQDEEVEEEQEEEEVEQSGKQLVEECNLLAELYCIVLYLQPVLNPKSHDGARVLEASGRPMLVIGRS